MPLGNFSEEWPTINPGEFRHEITLLVETLVKNKAGIVATWAPGQPPLTAWAKIRYIRGANVIKTGQEVTQTYVEITLWYRPEFATTGRLQGPNGSLFLIQSFENVREMNMFLVLTCLGLGSNT